MQKFIVDVNICKGCGLCVEVCPNKLLRIDKSSINKKGYCAVMITDEEKCISCAMCARMCPDAAISIYK